MSGSTFAVIGDFRIGRLVVECLRSSDAELAPPAPGRASVVDNDFGDDSAVHLTGAIRSNGWNARVDVIQLRRNRGFACGDDRAIEIAADIALGRWR